VNVSRRERVKGVVPANPLEVDRMGEHPRYPVRDQSNSLELDSGVATIHC